MSRTVTVVPHERGQSHTLRQGPVGRLLRLGTVRVDIVPGSFEVRASGLDADAAAEYVATLRRDKRYLRDVY